MCSIKTNLRLYFFIYFFSKIKNLKVTNYCTVVFSVVYIYTYTYMRTYICMNQNNEFLSFFPLPSIFLSLSLSFFLTNPIFFTYMKIIIIPLILYLLYILHQSLYIYIKKIKERVLKKKKMEITFFILKH